MTTDAWGVDDKFEDAMDVRRPTSAATRAAIHQAMGVEPGAKPAAPAVQVIRVGESSGLAGRGEIVLETGERRQVNGPLADGLPLGYHDFYPDRGSPVRLIVCPPRCYLPVKLKTWGWAVQLYSARSQASWGIGDLADLASLGSWARGQGAGLLLVNPLHAPAPGLPQESSPYYPSSRRFLNPLYLRIEEVPGFADLSEVLTPLAAQARALNAQPLINRDEIYRLKFAALDKLWQQFKGDSRFEHFCREQGDSLTQFAAYCVLAEQFGQNWRKWDASYRRPNAPGVQRCLDEHSDRVHFFKWLQWLLDEQLATAASALSLVQDLPIGASSDGADAWAWQDLLADGAVVGAPPDVYNTQGQNWNLPPLVPHKLQAAGYRPFVELVRATLRHARGLRIDHVLGLFRLYWIPQGLTAAQGAYVRYPAEDLLGIAALESQRAQAIIIGEDLGTVEADIRQRLAEQDILSYALLWFEKALPAKYPRKALAGITTHDLPTVAGLWNGSDLEEQRQLNLAPNAAADGALREHLRTMANLQATDSADTAILGAYRSLASAPSAVLAITLEDGLAISSRPNMPNTTADQRANWSQALPIPIDQLSKVDRLEELARMMAEHCDSLS